MGKKGKNILPNRLLEKKNLDDQKILNKEKKKLMPYDFRFRSLCNAFSVLKMVIE